jgi:hypothetical protein
VGDRQEPVFSRIRSSPTRRLYELEGMLLAPRFTLIPPLLFTFNL